MVTQVKNTNGKIVYEYLNQRFEKMGAVQNRDGVVFTMEKEPGASAELLIYEKGKTEVLETIPFAETCVMGNVTSVKVKGFSPAKHEYNFKINRRVVQDPYARVLRGNTAFGVETEDEHEVRCGIPTGSYDWEGDAPLQIPYEEAVMYNLHVRGFTKQKYSGVRHKGTFLGIVEKAEYLKELGVNQIKLMPAYDFTEIETVKVHADYRKLQDLPKRLNYWGYTQGCCFAPKRAYAATKDPVKEFKDMVKKMHKLGIEVLMEFYFAEETNPRYVVECLCYWMQEYHVDGFHILGNQELCNLIARDPIFAKTKLLNIYFPVENIYPNKKYPDYRTVAECNDGFMIDARRFLKGEDGCMRSFVERMRRNPAGSGLINYITNHDGFTMCDMVSFEERHNEENGEQNRDGRAQNFSWNCGEEGSSRKKKILELRRRQMRNAYCMLLLSAATPMLLAGDEIENSQNGNNNPYCLDSEVSWIDWKGLKSGKSEMLSFVKQLIAFRREHPILHMPKAYRMSDSLSCGFPDLSYHGSSAWYGDFDGQNHQIGMMYCGQYAGTEEFLYIAYNMHWAEHEFAIPNIPKDYQWYVAVDTQTGVYDIEKQPVLENIRHAVVPARTVRVFVGRKMTDVE